MIITVSVQMMSGKAVQVKVNPLSGLSGVEKALTAMDPEFFLEGLVTVKHSLEDATEITAEEKLWGFVHDLPMCRMENLTDEVIHGTNASYQCVYTHFHLVLESGEPCHMYVRTDTEKATFHIRSDPLTTAASLTTAAGLSERHPYDAMVGANIGGAVLSARDHYVIMALLQRFMPDIVYDGYRIAMVRELLLLCPCGHAVKKGSVATAAHLKTKRKHTHGDIQGRVFMKRATEYVNQMDEPIRMTHHIMAVDRTLGIDLDEFALLDPQDPMDPMDPMD